MKYLIPVIILILLGCALLYEADKDSATYDEVAHITAGYTYLYKHDFRLYPDNPPLIKMISVLPWYPIKDSLKFPEKSKNWNDPKKIDQWSLGKQFLYQSKNDADLLLFLARIPIILLTLSLGLLVFIIAKQFYGQRAGITALLLFSLSPDIRAHGHLATTDVGATFFALLGSFLLYTSLARRGLAKLSILSGIFFALAILSKYSMILVLLSVIAISLIYISKKFSLQNLSKIVLIALITYISLWVISIGIGYQNMNFSYENVPLNKSARIKLKDHIGWKIIQIVPLPYYYKTGLETMYARNILTQPTYLLGLVVPHGGLKLFFPLSYILKTPIPILILLCMSIALLIYKKHWQGLLPFVLGGLFFSLITLIGNLSIGTRFYYPSTVLFIITAASSISFLPSFRKKTLVYFRLTLGILLVWLGITNIQAFPYDISYINELGGGTMNGYNALVDSSYDWGQDLKRFATWYTKNGHGKEIKMSYLGTADPQYYHIKYVPLQFSDLQNPKGLIAISVTNLKLGGIYTKDDVGNSIYNDSILKNVQNKKPLARIGTTIFVYEF